MNDLLSGSHAVQTPSTYWRTDFTVQVTRYSRPCSSRMTGARTFVVLFSVFTGVPFKANGCVRTPIVRRLRAPTISPKV